MEIEPEYLPPQRGGTEQERVYQFYGTVRPVHPLAALLMGLAGLALLGVLLVFFFWVGVVLLCIGAVGMIVRILLGALRR